MVQSRASSHDISSGGAYVSPSAEYWKLKNHADTNKSAGYTNKSHMQYLKNLSNDPDRLYNKHDSLRLRKLAVRAERGLLIYDPCSTEDLRGFAQSRHLDLPTKIPPGRAGKAVLIALLEDADEKATFPLEKLPTELRLAVYGSYLEDLKFENTSPTQPPITQISKIVRKEALPLFYDIALFHLHLTFDMSMSGFLYGGFALPAKLNPSRRLFAYKHGPTVSQIRKLRVHVSMEGDKDGHGNMMTEQPYSMEVNFFVSTDGTLHDTPSLDRNYGKPGDASHTAWSQLTPAEQLRQSAPTEIDDILRGWHQELVAFHGRTAAEKLAVREEESPYEPPRGSAETDSLCTLGLSWYDMERFEFLIWCSGLDEAGERIRD